MAQRLIRYFTILGPCPESLQEGLKSLEQGTKAQDVTFKATALERFPLEDDDVPLSPLLQTLPEFCFKDGLQLLSVKPSPSPFFASFVFSTEKGGRLHVACLTVHERLHDRTAGGPYYTSKALCLVSLFPCLELLRSLLSDVLLAARLDDHEVAKSVDVPFERLVPRVLMQIFYELPLPQTRHSMVSLTAGLREVNLLDPDGLTRDFSFRPLVAFLSVTRLSQLFVLTLQERKVVLSSQQLCPALLVVILEALRALLFPLEWEHTYLPILPNSFRWALESPAPFLMGVSGSPIASAELPEDVVVFDLDTGKTLPEKMQVTVPQIIEQPLARLRNAHQWEQRPANKGYWAKYDHIRLGRPEVSGDAETPSPESPRGRTLRHRRSHSSTSAESGDDSDGLLSIQSSNLLSGAMGPAWTEEQERGFRQKVTAIFLEAMVLLLHRCPELSQKVQDTPESPTKSKDADAEKALLEEVRRSNAWERFMALPSNSPRRQLFDQAIRLYSFWSQEPAESRKPLDHHLRDWVTRLYEPPQLICLSELSVLRCGQLQPQIPIKKLLQQRLTSKKRSRFLPLGELNLKELFEVEVKKEKPERPSCTGVPRSVSLKLPQITPHSLGRCLGADHSSRHLPPDAIKYFLAAIPSALEELQSLLRKHEGEEGPSVSWLDGYAASKNKQDHLKPRLPNFVGAEPRPKGPHLEMGATCQVHGLREARSRCHCGCLNSIWDAIGASILGNTRNEQGHSCIQCAKCQSVIEPTLTLCKRLPRAPIDRSHSELSISTTGDSSMQIHLLNLKVCVERIRSRSLEELTEQQLLEEDPEVYWCLHIFYGLRAEIFWRMNANAPFVLASTGFNSLCRSYAAAKKQEARGAAGHSSNATAPEERSKARLPTAAGAQAEEFSDLALKNSTRRNASVERSVHFFEEEGRAARGAMRRPIRTVTLKDIGEACIVPQDDEEGDSDEDSEDAADEVAPKPALLRRKSTGLGPATPEMAFVHVNMEVNLDPLIVGDERPALQSRPGAPPELPARKGRRRTSAAKRPREGKSSSPRALKETSASIPEASASPDRPDRLPTSRSPKKPPTVSLKEPVRVKKPLVVASSRPKCRLLPGEGYALAAQFPRKTRKVAPTRGLVLGTSLEEQLVSEIAQLSLKIDEMRGKSCRLGSP